MPSSPSSRAAYEYADRLCARFPEVLASLAATTGLNTSTWCQHAGCSRDMMWRVWHGASIPTFHFGARLSHGAQITLVEFARLMEPG